MVVKYLIKVGMKLEEWSWEEQPRIRPLTDQDDLEREIKDERKNLEEETGDQFPNEIDYEFDYEAEDIRVDGEEHDQMWREICGYLGWKFIKS